MSPTRLVPRPVITNEDNDAMQYAIDALQYRSRSNLRKTETGELIWNDFAAVSLTLGLIIWKSIPQPAGIKRTPFLQQFLKNCGVTKTKRQIWSRVDKLRKVWKDTSYSTLLNYTDHSRNPSRAIGVADGSHREPTASDDKHDLDLQHAEPESQGSSSVSLNSPSHTSNSQRPRSIVNEAYAIPPQPTTSTTWAPSSSQFSVDISGDQYIQGLNTYHEYCQADRV